MTEIAIYQVYVDICYLIHLSIILGTVKNGKKMDMDPLHKDFTTSPKLGHGHGTRIFCVTLNGACLRPQPPTEPMGRSEVG